MSVVNGGGERERYQVGSERATPGRVGRGASQTELIRLDMDVTPPPTRGRDVTLKPTDRAPAALV